MEPNCNLELRLSSSLSFSDHDSGDRCLSNDESSKNSQPQMTIFYNGRVCVADFTEDRARAILMLATKQMEERSASRPQKSKPVLSPESVHYGAGSRLSMQRSLQRFLQKRKKRVQSASPYNH